MRKIGTVLFDFDGTVMDTNDVILKSWQHAFRQILGKTADEGRLLKTFGEPLKMTMKNFFGGDEEQVERNVEIYRSYQRDHYLDLISLFPGVREMLEEVKSAGFKTALVTSRLKPTTYDGLRKFGIEAFFDCIITADDVTKHKPDPQPVFRALEALGSAAGSALMLGDTRQDILAAKNAGVASVLVEWSMALPKETAVGELEPSYFLGSPRELINLISTINDARAE